MQFRLSFFIGLIYLALAGCVKTPEYPVEPEISLLWMSDTTISAGDYLKFTIEFQDGDGDIGHTTPFTDTFCVNRCDTFCYIYEHPTVDLFYIDSRVGNCIGIPTHIPFIESKGSSKGITGEIDFNTASILCAGQNQSETYYYTIMIRDRARNLSNRIRTPMITIRCQ